MTDASNQQPEPFNLNSDDVAARKRADLKRLFPEVFNEDKVDLDQLRRVMGDWVDEGSERFGLTWPGKAACMKVIQAPAAGSLRPDRDESVNFDESENVFIEGDNLEVLKLLQKAYFGKIKMIYIDPPYNTGNEFIYPDNYAENLETYLAYTGQIDSEGRRFSTNTDASGRFHSRWINMMYPRLYLARNLLRDDGLIFVSLDDGEIGNLRAVMDYIFGEENFVANVAWEKRYTRSNNAKRFYSLKDNILVYRKSEELDVIKEKRTEKADSNYSNPDDDPRGEWATSSYVNPATKDKRPNLVYEIENPFTGEMVVHPTHAWKHSRAENAKHIEEGRLWWGKDGSASFPRLKIYLAEQTAGLVPIDLWDYKSVGTTDEGGQEIKDLFGVAVFDTAKPTRLIQKMLGIATEPNDIVLDFFAGSCSTAHAVFKENIADGGGRKFIMVQLPEICSDDSLAAKEGFRTISQLGRERVRRCADALSESSEGANQDLGFRAFKLASSAFARWDAASDETEADLLTKIEQHSSNLGAEGTEDILFEILLKDGFELTTKVDEATVAGGKVYSVADGVLLICLERNLTKDIIDALVDLAEEKDAARVVCLDAGFQGNDQLKANAVQTFKSRLGHGEDGSMFRTV